MNYEYPILKKVANFYKSKLSNNLSNYIIYSCQHLLEPQLEMYKKLIEFGFLPKNIFVLGKIYSSNYEIINEMKQLGLSVEQPELKIGGFNSQHTDNCKKIISGISDQNINIILDDGASLIEEGKKISKNILFAVEQTSSGFRKLEGKDYSFPIFNVARSKTKLTQESPLIGRLIADRIEDYLENLNILNPRFLIVGLGPIGSSLKQIMDSKFSVLGIDKGDTDDLIKYINDNDIDVVIGATGTRIIDKEGVDSLVNGKNLYLISVSSSDIEFPVEYYRKDFNPHHDIKFKNITFVNNGFPITFKGNRYESTPIEIEKTIALLMGSVMSGVIKDNKKQGLVDIPEELEKLISQKS